MDVRVDLAHVVEVAVGHGLLGAELAPAVEEHVEVEALLEDGEALEGERLDGPGVDDALDLVEGEREVAERCLLYTSPSPRDRG